MTRELSLGPESVNDLMDDCHLVVVPLHQAVSSESIPNLLWGEVLSLIQLKNGSHAVCDASGVFRRIKAQDSICTKTLLAERLQRRNGVVNRPKFFTQVLEVSFCVSNSVRNGRSLLL